jgi:KipI family sensor histidine kinase inhibitor
MTDQPEKHPSKALRVRLTGDAALTAEFEPRADVVINRAAAALGRVVRGAALSGVRDVVVTTSAVTAYVEPLVVDWRALETLLSTPVEPTPTPAEQEEPLIVPVRYGGAGGPDLEEVASRCGCSPDEVIARHAGRTYRVFMIGFMPGFAYLGPLDERLRLGRRETPRLRVPAGAVAIAGAQTAIYPLETPGGWWVIGRTSLRMFDALRQPASLLDVGRAVQFEAA